VSSLIHQWSWPPNGHGLGRRSDYPDPDTEHGAGTTAWWALEAVDLDGLLIKSEALVCLSRVSEMRLLEDETKLLTFGNKELLDLGALIALELDHLAHTLGLGVTNDGAIAS